MKAPVLGHVSPGSSTDKLASFTAELDLADVPEVAKGKAVDILLDSVASALVGRHGDETRQIEALATAIGGRGDSTVIAGEPLSLVGAVLLNGYQVTAVTICDMHVAALNHVTPGVVAPALALAEREAASGRDLIRSILVGLETAVRIGLAINFTAFRERGWHAPGVIGPFASAAASGSLLRLDRDRMINALGLAGSQSAGTYAAWGTPTVKFHQTRGGVSGLLAGLLAAEGFRSSRDFLEHPDGGLFTTYSEGADATYLTDRLGVEWRFPEVNLRRWPAATQFQSIIEALLGFVAEHEPDFESIERVRLRLPVEVFEFFGGFGWEDKFRARLSPRYVASVVLADRRCWVDQFQDDRLRDVRITDFARDRVSVEADASVTGVGVVAEITIGGRTHLVACPVPRGAGDRPLDRSEIVNKFHDARAGFLSDAAAAEFLGAISNLESIDDVRPVVALLRPST